MEKGEGRREKVVKLCSFFLPRFLEFSAKKKKFFQGFFDRTIVIISHDVEMGLVLSALGGRYFP